MTLRSTIEVFRRGFLRFGTAGVVAMCGLVLIANEAWMVRVAARLGDMGFATPTPGEAKETLPAPCVGEAPQPIYLVGDVTIGTPPRDPVFGLSFPAVRLLRHVGTYQWREDRGQEPGALPNYRRGWHEGLIHSMMFRVQEGHENPLTEDFRSQVFNAEEVRVAGLPVAASLRDALGPPLPIPYTEAMRNQMPLSLRRRTMADEGILYISKAPATPVVGDVKIEFEQVVPEEISLLAACRAGMIVPLADSTGQPWHAMMQGDHSALQILATHRGWGLRPFWLTRVAACGLFWWILSRRRKQRRDHAQPPATPARWKTAALEPMLFLAPIFLIASFWLLIRPHWAAPLLAGAVLCGAVWTGWRYFVAGRPRSSI